MTVARIMITIIITKKYNNNYDKINKNDDNNDTELATVIIMIMIKLFTKFLRISAFKKL